MAGRVYTHCYMCKTRDADARFQRSGLCSTCLKIRNMRAKEKPCTRCHEALGVAGGYCKPCRAKYAGAYNATHREQLNVSQRERYHAGANVRESELRRKYSRAVKKTVLEAYGGRCACCGEA